MVETMVSTGTLPSKRWLGKLTGGGISVGE